MTSESMQQELLHIDVYKRQVLKSDFIPLTMNFMPTKMNADDVCSAAGKED